MSGEATDRPGGAVDARLRGGAVRSWAVLEADRWSVAAAIGGLLLAALLVPSLAGPEAASAALAAGDPVETLFQALVAGIVTGVTLVVTITQLVLSQELGAAGDQRERMRGALSFQEDLEGTLDRGVSPPQPAAFLGWLVEGLRERAEALRDRVRASEGELGRWIDDFMDDVSDDAALVVDRLEGAEFGTFEVVHAALDYNYSWKIHLCRRLRLLLAYMLRIATVTQRTLAMGPFVLRRTDRDGELVRRLDAIG